MTVHPALRAFLIVIGLVALVTALAIGVVTLPLGVPRLACMIAVLGALTGAQILLDRAWGVVVLPVLAVVATLVPMTIDASRRPVAHMWPLAIVGVIIFLIPALMIYLAVVHGIAEFVRRRRARRAV